MAEVFGIQIADIPSGAQPIEVVVLVKVLTTEGSVALIERASDGLTSWEALGMVTTFGDTLRSQLQGMYSRDDDD